jgi:streptomycin 6-kinase
MTIDVEDFAPWLERWALTPDGAPFTSLWRSRLLPVLCDGAPAMLKVAGHPEEQRGAAVMAWYAARGAAKVYAHDDQAVVLERLSGPRSLVQMARGGEDAEACRILCGVAAELHAPRPDPPATLVPLERWFAALWPSAQRRGGVYAKAAEAARELFATAEPPRALHGDIHHGNVMDGGARGWLAIDPKGLWGDRGYDYANLIGNPDAETALAYFERRVEIAAELSGLAPERILRWVLAYMGLSASWTADSGGDPWQALAIAERAASALER